MVQQQRRSRVIAMTPAELDSFLAEQRTCRLATTGPDGPHVAPLWFVWDTHVLWVSSLTRSQRWANISRDPRVAVVVDDGHHYHELRGVEIEGEAAVVGPVPRTSEDPAVPELAEPERLMAAKYSGGSGGGPDGRHALAAHHPGQDRQLGLPQARHPAGPGRARLLAGRPVSGPAPQRAGPALSGPGRGAACRRGR